MSTAPAKELPSFSRGLFLGKLSSDSVFPYPVQTGLSAETKETLGMLVEPTKKFFAEVNNAAANDENSGAPKEILEQLKGMGAFGLMVPEEFEGAGLNNTGYARAVEIVGGADLGLGILLGAHQSIGYRGILLYGTPEQKAKYLPDLASGRKIAAFVLTEPGAGSDAAGIKTRAKLSEDGKHYILNGSKIWISNGPDAEIMTVFAKTEGTDKKTGEKKDVMIAFIVERSFGGVTSGPPEKKMGIKCSPTSEVFFENCKVPVENVLLAPGDGFKVAMGILNSGRFGMGAALTGTMKTAIKGAIEYANQRVQFFGNKIREYEVIRDKVAGMASRLYATESLAYLLASNMDRGMTDYQIEAAVGKVFASENAWHCVDETIQIYGGIGYMRALPYERMLRDLRIFRIFEGTNDILRQMIGLTGIQSLGKELEPLAKAAKSPLTNIPVLLPYALAQLKAKAGIFDKPSLDWAPAQLRPAADVIETATGQFAHAVQALTIKHGKKVLERQLDVAKVADIIIDLTAATAAVSRAATSLKAGAATAEHEVALANLFAEDAKHRLAANIRGMSGGHKRLNELKNSVAKQLLDAGAYTPTHPTGIN